MRELTCAAPKTSDKIILIFFALVALMTLVLCVRLAGTLFRRDHPFNAHVPWSGRLLATAFGLALAIGWLVFAAKVLIRCV